MVESIIIISLLGLSLGSFINVCVYRLPRGLSIVDLRSSCPHCQKQLTWFELIPVISFAAALGKCKGCGGRISVLYPVVEILGAGLIVAAFLQNGITLRTLELFVFSLLMLAVVIIDWKHLIIPNQIVIVGFICGLAMKALVHSDVLVYSIISSIVSFAAMAIILLLANFIFKKETMGWGDVKLAGVIGLFLGFQNFLIVLWLAAICGSLYGLWLVRRRGVLRETRIPFGSFLAATACVVFYFQESISELLVVWLTYAQ